MKLMSSQARSHYVNRNEISTLHFLHIHQLLHRLKRQLRGPEVFAKCFRILAAGVQCKNVATLKKTVAHVI